MSLALTFLIFACSSFIDINNCKAIPVISPKIKNAPNNAYPFIVSIQLRRGSKISWTSSQFEHYCGGSLITRKHVLTAAHCFPDTYITANYRVFVGSNDLINAKMHYVQSWLTYDKWTTRNNIISEYSENDIAIVELSSLVDAGIKLATITNASNDRLRSQQVLSAGWGKISDGSIPRYMVEVQLTMISHETCLQNIRAARVNHTDEPEDTLDENTFCTNGKPYAVLYCGDSGSPVFWKNNEIIGINESVCPIEREDSVTTKEQNIHVDARLYLDFIGTVTDNCTIEQFTSDVSSCWIL